MSKAGEKPAGKNAPASPHQLENQFLPAWTDPVAGLSTFSAGICTENLYGDGHRLLVADEDGTLKVRYAAHDKRVSNGLKLASSVFSSLP